MYNSAWQVLYADVFTALSAIEEITKYREMGANSTLANQYIAEAKTIQAFLLFNLSRLWGAISIPMVNDPTSMLEIDVTSKDGVMQYISKTMDEAISLLPDKHPNERTDIRGGVTRYTALAIKALANLELKNYQAVADATSEIIKSHKFELSLDYYNLFKIPGKLDKENLLELQYSDYGKGAGDANNYEFIFFGPDKWKPAKNDSEYGWGFYEPSLTYIKFMLDREDTKRLETSVLFTNRGIEEIKKDPKYVNLPSWISNQTRWGDIINDFARAMFVSGKHYLPSNQLTDGRTAYGSNKNFICIRYAEILLMYAEALTNGASGSAGSATDAINLIRDRAGLGALSNVTNAQVMDEKFAELAMEWGTRFYDMVRLGKYAELSYEGRVFDQTKIFLPYPQTQVDLLPKLKKKK
jgi:hypothetical protein